MKKIHLINPMWDDSGGSEHRVNALYEQLKQHAKVEIWSEFEPASYWLETLPLKRLSARRLCFPLRGTMVFVGAYFPVGDWVRWAMPQRTILLYNTSQPELFRRQLKHLSCNGRREVELLYASEWLKEQTGLPGIVQPSLIDTGEFSPRNLRRPTFTVGRLSRDVPEKHHVRDVPFYQRLVAAGLQVRIMGGTVLQSLFPGQSVDDGIALLPAQAQPASQFLAELDCFYYRTAEDWFEPAGRVITEAMAMGLPVVACRRGGYAEWIESGVNGFLFDAEDEAYGYIEQLRNDPDLRSRVGQAARKTVEQIFSDEVRSKLVRFFCGE